MTVPRFSRRRKPPPAGLCRECHGPAGKMTTVTDQDGVRWAHAACLSRVRCRWCGKPVDVTKDIPPSPPPTAWDPKAGEWEHLACHLTHVPPGSARPVPFSPGGANRP